MTLTEWLFRGEVGVSSKTLCAGLLGQKMDGYDTDVPMDCDDFRRCFLFYAVCIGDWNKAGGWKKILDTYPWLAPYAERWDVLCHMHGNQEFAALHHDLNLLRVASMRLRYPNAEIKTAPDGSLRYAMFDPTP